ncbi:hypothetical protein DPMN_170268 [Dreissena polymorpha]|uniref:Uncharacterized protein n=1 Tax=Dreissena polymorpha TaxID=45954 RepID=A0A9D4DWP9_DREPO|nr:hypothetical protein DPMN_170268 [Dreissena polymorpha]
MIHQYERDYTDELELFSDLSELNTIDEFLIESTSKKVIVMSDDRGSITHEDVENTLQIDDHIQRLENTLREIHIDDVVDVSQHPIG